eukprot:CAMPEP_0170521566 /NCGR_PEP_ID=MMETSP0209-20121228/6949_1 /TAXON_ID=665100 ORGANISM="Litonotus pictus, Strain P1" /NCGR_SAMPLE_ID=MMETSP0209 /ASSEMBLY_ACC=CAM_ASM_000301 /LENGTH=416 /DNA_ID=CAMNT_0010808527 /DNA_START=208 /DNA_END=1455 /DNA_ORIENTATION=-
MPKENIIVMAYDDIAYNEMNPFKGKVFNRPDPQGFGHDYYEGVNIDYKGEDVNPQNFLSILRGDKEAVKGKGNGRVLESGSEDKVFIYFADHGAVGLIAFPNDQLLYADELTEVLKTMNKEKKFNKLVFYLESCESGSMFKDVLPDNISVYATTAASPVESSFAVYCDSKIFGLIISTCLGDEYSIAWLEDSDKDNKSESLSQQFSLIEKKVRKSYPMQFGDMSFKEEPIFDYQGVQDSNNNNSTEERGYANYVYSLFDNPFENLLDMLGISREQSVNNKNISQGNGHINDSSREIELDVMKDMSRINSRDVKLHYLYQQANKAGNLGDNYELSKELNQRRLIDDIFKTLAIELKLNLLGEDNSNIQFDCLRESVKEYRSQCGNFTEYTLKYVQYLSVACKNSSVDTIKYVIQGIC